VHHAAVHQRGADHGLAFAAHQQHLVERDLGADIAVKLLDHEQIARLDPVLFAAGLDHRVHGADAFLVSCGPVKGRCAKMSAPAREPAGESGGIYSGAFVSQRS
jgi:hypothetical protein